MSVVIVGGNERMIRRYEALCERCFHTLFACYCKYIFELAGFFLCNLGTGMRAIIAIRKFEELYGHIYISADLGIFR